MSVLEMFKKKMLTENRLLRAKRNMKVFTTLCFRKGRPYRIVNVGANGITLRGESLEIKGKVKSTWQLTAKPSTLSLFPWGNFSLIGKKAKAIS